MVDSVRVWSGPVTCWPDEEEDRIDEIDGLAVPLYGTLTTIGGKHSLLVRRLLVWAGIPAHPRASAFVVAADDQARWDVHRLDSVSVSVDARAGEARDPLSEPAIVIRWTCGQNHRP